MCGGVATSVAAWSPIKGSRRLALRNVLEGAASQMPIFQVHLARGTFMGFFLCAFSRPHFWPDRHDADPRFSVVPNRNP